MPGTLMDFGNWSRSPLLSWLPSASSTPRWAVTVMVDINTAPWKAQPSDPHWFRPCCQWREGADEWECSAAHREQGGSSEDCSTSSSQWPPRQQEAHRDVSKSWCLWNGFRCGSEVQLCCLPALSQAELSFACPSFYFHNFQWHPPGGCDLDQSWWEEVSHTQYGRCGDKVPSCVFDGWLRRFGCPRTLVTDKGRGWASDEMLNWTSKYEPQALYGPRWGSWERPLRSTWPTSTSPQWMAFAKPWPASSNQFVPYSGWLFSCSVGAGFSTPVRSLVVWLPKDSAQHNSVVHQAWTDLMLTVVFAEPLYVAMLVRTLSFNPDRRATGVMPDRLTLWRSVRLDPLWWFFEKMMNRANPVSIGFFMELSC